jgi:putative ABC transport system substrate-binding protein
LFWITLAQKLNATPQNQDAIKMVLSRPLGGAVYTAQLLHFSKRLALLAPAFLVLLGQPTAWSEERIYKVGILVNTSAASPPPLYRQFTDALGALGYIPGQNVTFEYRGSEGKNDRFPLLVTDLVQQQVDVIFSGAAPAIRAAKQITSTVPVVFLVAADPVALGLVKSLERPDGNMTGLTEEAPDLSAKRTALLKEIIPQTKKIGILWDANAFGEQIGLEMARKTEQAVRAAGVQAEIVAVRGSEDLQRAFSSLKEAQVDGLLIEPSPMFFGQAKLMVELAAATKIATIYPWPQFTQAGGLASLGADLDEYMRRAAGYVDKILRGANPGDLPVGKSDNFLLVVNVKAATGLGISIPPQVQARADRVIE